MSMQIVIVGSGEVGFNLAQMLSAENHDVTIIDNKPEKCQRAREHLDVAVVEADGANAHVLSEAGAGNAHMMIAVTSVDEVNIMACMLASRLGVPKIIARVRDDQYSRPGALINPSQLGIDLMIHPEYEAAAEIVRLMHRASASDVIEFAGGRVQVVGFKLPPGAPIIGQTLREVVEDIPELSFRTVGIARNGATIIPSGNDSFMPDDHIFVVTERKSILQVMELAGKKDEVLTNAMILGGGKIGRLVGKMLEGQISLKIIESNTEKSQRIAHLLKDALVIKGDGTDIELLQGEDIDHVDGFIAVTQDDKTNIISGLLAKHLGARKTIVHVTRHDYLPVVDMIGLDAVVSKTLATIDAILKYVRRGEIRSVTILEGTDIEAIELVPQVGSRVTTKPLGEMSFPDGAIVGVQIHKDGITIAKGNTVIVPGDDVVVFALPEAIAEVEKLFSA